MEIKCIRDKVVKMNINKRKFLKAKPWNWGKGTEKTSSEIDETLYV